ncbi:S1 family peptidase [Micromonospora sp. NBC_01813]|uniref:S1 family peptidase n=1 Tax=Micromonospora sp. NBC_01813 TaxID=2975988 RepID=UPI002DD94D1F|nr:S1 family peptidase [Micromonospora sp. NBC_01813]WSA11674.1 S1 family peptidase [Micromonospora sp. NBC_01813]
MRRRRLITAGVTVAAVGVLAAVTLPAVAGDDRQTGDDRASVVAQRSDEAAPIATEMVDALRRDLGISERDARARVATERWATSTVDTLRAEFGDAWGGAWITADGTDLVVAVTDPDLAEQVRDSGAQVRVVARSQRQLDEVKQRLDGDADVANPDLAGWYVDVADNTVVLLARPGAQAAARDFATGAGVPTDAVRVQASEEAPVPLADVRGGDPYFIGGGGRCSVGFSVVGGFVTAGHCGRVGATTTGFDQQAQGVFRASSFPGDDWAFVEVNGDWTPQPVVNDFNGGTLPVAGGAEAPVGASVCRFGSTTGTSCGVIQAKNATVNYPEGAVTGMTRTDACAEPGDSGGSWLSGDQAQGVTSGGSGNCTVGGVTFFQPLAEILQVNDLTLVTTQDGAIPPTDAPAPPTAGPGDPEPPAGQPQSRCAAHTVVRQGDLAEVGAREVQPDGQFFRAGAGRHTACLEASGGADFELALQRFTAQGWRTVARDDTDGAVAELSFAGPAGSYRYRVESGQGVGGYLLGFSVN